MDFQTLEISFHPEGADFTSGRITHFAQFVEKKSVYAFPPEEEFLGIFINLGDNQRYLCGDTNNIFQSHHYNLMYLTPHAYEFVLERGYHSWLCLHYTYKDLSYLSVDAPMLREFLSHLHDSAAVTMTQRPLPAPYQMLDIIHDMMLNRFTGASRDYYLYMKSTGVLAASLMQTLEIPKAHLCAKDLETLNTIRDYLVDNFRFSHTAAELADKAGMSEYHLKLRFHALFGKSVPDYILELRMNKAKELLGDTDLPVKDIAVMVGYHSASTFVHAFHREIGIAPGEFREKETQI